MSKDMMNPSRDDNRVKIVGKVVDITFRQGKNKTGADYMSYVMHIRVNQEVNKVMETSDIEVQSYANKYTNAGGLNPSYIAIDKLHTLKTIENVGIDEADIVRISTGTLQDNSYVSKNSRQVVRAWRVDARYIDVIHSAEEEVASYTGYIFITDMLDEEDTNGDLTGRLIVKAALARYGGKIDMVEFVAEDPNQVEWLRDNWMPKSTVAVRAWLRTTKKERVAPVDENSDGWGGGFSVGGSSTRTVRELVIEKAGRPLDEEIGYDPTEMRKAYNVYKAGIEQQIANATAPAASTSSTKKTASAMGWE